jgi:hypothetical protein
VTDWGTYLACDVCKVLMGERCLLLSSGGPDALPAEYRDVPHGSRKLSKVRTRPQTATATGRNPVATRRARSQGAKVSGWSAIADRQRVRRETQ